MFSSYFKLDTPILKYCSTHSMNFATFFSTFSLNSSSLFFIISSFLAFISISTPLTHPGIGVDCFSVFGADVICLKLSIIIILVK